jgi:hypothetical protein
MADKPVFLVWEGEKKRGDILWTGVLLIAVKVTIGT